MAIVFFTGGSGTPAQLSTGTNPAGIPAGVTTSPRVTSGPVSAGTSVETALPTPVPTSVPASGVFVKVNYLGSFTGTYGANGLVTKVQDSGERTYVLDDAAGTITASFQKDDTSTRHDLSVEIWKDGKAVKIGKSSEARGIVSISYP